MFWFRHFLFFSLSDYISDIGHAVNPEEAPSGMISRGHYNAISTFVDDDDNTHLKFEWSFDIGKDW